MIRVMSPHFSPYSRTSILRFFSSPTHLPPRAVPTIRVCLPLGPEGGRATLPCGCGGWGTQFGRLDRKPGTLGGDPLVWWVRGRGDPTRTTAQKACYSVYSVSFPLPHSPSVHLCLLLPFHVPPPSWSPPCLLVGKTAKICALRDTTLHNF